MDDIIKVRIVSSIGAGVDGTFGMPAGSTVSDAFDKVADADDDTSLGNLKVRVNQEDVDDPDFELSDGDRVSFTPKNIKGA